MNIWILSVWIGVLLISATLLAGCMFGWVDERLGARLPDAPKPQPADIEFRYAVFFPSFIIFCTSALSAAAMIMIAGVFKGVLAAEELEAMSLVPFIAMIVIVLVIAFYDGPRVIAAWRRASA